jgi:hypothetical protein
MFEKKVVKSTLQNVLRLHFEVSCGTVCEESEMCLRPQVKMEGIDSLSEGRKPSRKCHVQRMQFNETTKVETNCRLNE